MKIKSLLIIVTLFCTCTAHAQTPEEQFYNRLVLVSNDIESVKGDFTQIKEFKALDVKVVSKGSFKYVRNDEIRFDYTEPRVMSIVVDGAIVKIIAGEKTTTYPLIGQRNAMAETAFIMDHCMKGHLHDLRTGYSLDYQDTGRYHKVTVRHRRNVPDNAFESIELLFDKDRYSLEEMAINERSGYVTTYTFTGMTVGFIR